MKCCKDSCEQTADFVVTHRSTSGVYFICEGHLVEFFIKDETWEVKRITEEHD